MILSLSCLVTLKENICTHATVLVLCEKLRQEAKENEIRNLSVGQEEWSFTIHSRQFEIQSPSQCTRTEGASHTHTANHKKEE